MNSILVFYGLAGLSASFKACHMLIILLQPCLDKYETDRTRWTQSPLYMFMNAMARRDLDLSENSKEGYIRYA
jgi:hypothetical protein